MATKKPPSGELTLPELVEALAGLLASGYVGARSGRIRDLPDARTIRWYQTLAMVDRPTAFRGRTALYGRHHLLQLAAIKKLQSSGFPLADIQRGLAGKNDAELARSAGVTMKDADRVVERVALARSKSAASTLAAAVAGFREVHAYRDSAFWKASPATTPEPAPVPPAPSGMQSASLGDAGMLLWNGRELTAAERAALAQLAGPLVAFLKSVQSSAADTAAEGAPRAASPIRRPEEGARP
jgi:DNA-binding transcriptional MerR regulator